MRYWINAIKYLNGMKILVGTTNKGKQKEYKKLISAFLQSHQQQIEIIFPQDLNISETPVETGKTFAENSLLKAKFYFEKSGVPTIADDGGLQIPILNNEPGIFSRRWVNEKEATDEELIDYTLHKLKVYKAQKDRKAYLSVCITYYDGKNVFQEVGKIDGYISNQTNRNYIKGYPYRALFIVLGLGKYYDQLTEGEHNQYNHRKIALTKLWDKINAK